MSQKDANYNSKDRPVVVRDSDALTHIDGFLVTDGDRCRVTMSKRLTRDQKEQGVEHLLNEQREKSGAGVYLWNHK